MEILGQAVAPLGMGCWPIGGEMYSGNQSVGYTRSNDAESIRTIHAALDGGITLFDTAAAYGAGHAERLLAQALKGRMEALVVTKIGIAIDEDTKQLTGDQVEPESVIPAIDRCLARLERDRIDILLLHQNGLSVEQAEPVFDAMETAVSAGKIRAYGWSTDFSASAAAMANRENFIAIEHAMNVLLDTPNIQSVLDQHALIALIRSPLAMGLLSGKYGAEHSFGSADIRSTSNPKTAYFLDAKANPAFLQKMDAIHDLLTSGGRSLVQGALGWLWAKRADNIAIPGARTVEQMEGLVGALAHGALPAAVMDDIESLIDRGAQDQEERAL
ncbi:MAG: aldo/keto reductase [Pseudomonadota bacterium]